MSALGTGQRSSAETGQMSAVETGQMSAAETSSTNMGTLRLTIIVLTSRHSVCLTNLAPSHYAAVSILFGCQTWVIQGTTETFCRPLSRPPQARGSWSLIWSAAVAASASQDLMSVCTVEAPMLAWQVRIFEFVWDESQWCNR